MLTIKYKNRISKILFRKLLHAIRHRRRKHYLLPINLFHIDFLRVLRLQIRRRHLVENLHHLRLEHHVYHSGCLFQHNVYKNLNLIYNIIGKYIIWI